VKKPGTLEAGCESTTVSALPRVVERYSEYTPPFDVKSPVEKMVRSVPPNYLVGLEEIILTNTAGLPRKFRRRVTKSRKKTVKMIKARGLYHPAWKNRRAWIEIFVDNTFRIWERGWWLKFRLHRETLVGDVLFHEIGHHIHFAVRPEHREREDIADQWKVRLTRSYFRQNHRLLGTILRSLRLLFGPLFRAFYKKTMDRGLGRGWMSRAEYDESMK
jgi:hypothetical protein